MIGNQILSQAPKKTRTKRAQMRYWKIDATNIDHCLTCPLTACVWDDQAEEQGLQTADCPIEIEAQQVRLISIKEKLARHSLADVLYTCVRCGFTGGIEHFIGKQPDIIARRCQACRNRLSRDRMRRKHE